MTKNINLIFTAALITLFFTPANAAEIQMKKIVYFGSSSACSALSHIQINEDGYINWVFRRYDLFGSCIRAKISLVTSLPSEQLRGVKGLKNDGSFDKTFTIITTPETETLFVHTINNEGFGGIAEFALGTERERLLEIHKAGDWMTNFNNSETKLAESAAADKTPPTVQVLSPTSVDGQVTRVDTYTSFIRGKVTDDAGVMTILVAGRKVGIKEDGTFASKVKLAIGRNDVLVQAEDINGNVSEKTITFIREEFITDDVLADVDLPPQTKMSNPDALAVVIGVESYQYVPDATFAYNDAEVFREYLAETMGMKRQRIKLATNSKATQAEFSKLLGPNGWLARNVVKGKSDVVVYFSGHGIASADAKSSGILPFDVDPNYSVGLPTEQLYKDLSAMGAKSVTVFLDACFTGQTRNSEMLIANARPIVIRPSAQSVPSNVTVISAASGSQISGAIEEKEHGLFTYYVLKGLGGEADANKDTVLKMNELNEYVSTNVREQAALNGREQTPELQGDAARILVRFQ